MLKKRKLDIEEFWQTVEKLPANLNRNLAFMLLQKMDVRTAMNLAQIKNEKFGPIYEIMEDDAIWKFWFQRDLDPIYFAFRKHDFAWIKELQEKDYTPDLPIWKLVYLWYRLLISLQQFEYSQRLFKLERFTPYLPPDSTVNYQFLNTVEVTLSNGKISYYDFRDMWPRTEILLRREESSEYPNYSQQFAVDINTVANSDVYDLFFDKLYPMSYKYGRSGMMEACDALRREFENTRRMAKFNLEKSLFWFRYRPQTLKTLSKFPRIVEETKLIVACKICPQETKFICGKCKQMGYCSRSCQENDWVNHKKSCF